MSKLMKTFARLVPFLGEALGQNCEVALLDCSKNALVEIVNGHISGRQVGAPITDLASRIIQSGKWREQDYITNYTGLAAGDKLLRSSTYFIREGENLAGMLCINIDTTDYQTISRLAGMLGGLSALTSLPLDTDSGNERETFYKSIPHAIHDVLCEMYGDITPASFTQQERVEIISRLNDRGVFLIKGAVSQASELLGCSESSMYRYLSKINGRARGV